MSYNARDCIVTWGNIEIPVDNITPAQEVYAAQKMTGAGQLTYATYGEESCQFTLRPDSKDLIEDLYLDAKNRTQKPFQVYDGNTGRVLLRYDKSVIGNSQIPAINRSEGSADSLTFTIYKEGL